MLRKVLNHHDAGRAKINAYLNTYEKRVAQKMAEASQLAANAEESQQQVAAVAAMPVTVAEAEDVDEKVAVQVVADATTQGEQFLATQLCVSSWCCNAAFGWVTAGLWLLKSSIVCQQSTVSTAACIRAEACMGWSRDHSSHPKTLWHHSCQC